MSFTIYWKSLPTDSETFSTFISMAKHFVNPKIEFRVTHVKTKTEMGEIRDSILEVFSRHEKGDSFIVKKNSNGLQFCRTNNLIYTRDIQYCIIIMIEHGMAYDVISEYNKGFLDALEKVNSQFRLSTYEFQKKYFESVTF
jgi:hypothetical protein